MGMSASFAGFRRETLRGVPLLWRRDERFKTLRVSYLLRRPLDGSTAARGLLPELLAQGTQRYPSRQQLVRRQEELYGGAVATSVGKTGEAQVLHALFDGVAGRFLPGAPDQLSDGLLLLGELLLRPRLEGNGFPEVVFAREQRNQRNAVRAEFDDKASWARRQALALACEGEPMAIPEHGGLAAIDALTPSDPETARHDLLVRGDPLVLAMGAIDDSALQRLDAFLAGLPSSAPAPLPPVVQVVPRPARFTLQRAELTQSKLVMVFRFPPGDRDAWLARRVFANLLGGGPHARLFREVREARSLAYSVQAGADSHKGLMLVAAGLDEAAASAVRDEVLRQIAELRAGRFSNQELATAKAGIASGLAAVDDSIAARVGFTWERWLDGGDREPDAQAQGYLALTPEQVAESGAGLWLDHVFLLAPTGGGGA